MIKRPPTRGWVQPRSYGGELWFPGDVHSRGVVLPPSEEPVEEALTFFRMPRDILMELQEAVERVVKLLPVGPQTHVSKGDRLEQTSGLQRPNPLIKMVT